MILLDIVAALLLFAPLCVAGVSDYRHMIVPNWTSAAIVLGFVVFAAAHWSQLDISMHLVIAGVFFGLSLLCWFLGWLGGGDVKLLGAVGLWLGTAHAFAFLFILAVTSAVLSGALLVLRKFSRREPDDESTVLKPILRMARDGEFAYAVPIVLAAFVTLPRYFF